MTMTYTKSTLIRDVANDLGFSQTNTAQILDAALARILAHAQSDETVNLPGFGRFKVRTRAARIGRNPHTGEAVQIHEKRILTFTPTKTKA